MNRLLRRLALPVGVATVAVVARRRRVARVIDGHVADLLAAAAFEPGDTVSSADLEGLPAPVERYLRTVLEEGLPGARTARLHQRGEFRLGGANAPWRPLEATQHVSVAPPGFVWDATIEVVPLVPARVVDLYAGGEGLLRATLFSAVPVASAGPSPAMNEGELVRYLAETPWYPTALLPGRGVEWEPIDDRTARATLEHAGLTASVDFHFDDRNEVERVTTDRYRQEDDSYAPWTGYFREYEVHSGRRVPTAAVVEWTLPDGDLPYWRARIDALEYDVADGTR